MTAKAAAEEIKRRVTAVEAADKYGLSHDKAGFAVCPFHGDTAPSLKLYAGARGWTCFGCHAGGSVIDLVMRLTDTDFCQAVEKINRDFCLGLPLGTPPDAQTMAQERRQDDERRRVMRERKAAVRAANEAYFDTQGAYMDNERVITSNEPDRDGAWSAEFSAALGRRAALTDSAERALDALREVIKST